ncbi:glutamine--fructose-6-phosphate transaminase (isomerizing) [bacterium endosymbiont of Pedicinus badii]|uniref:glutamine--fructose-6-phosphate transaminase (isomerizing) n=1 Tax=bacterium endosymbiont of Pedicinus badii TaxID=1719126 RepID=UPI0009BC69B8|nr:glutamine--fructose-6-phosphate transaminase (isomerizing) [bacterium endosymbiont of Pedicinus badii]OQM34067.1 hypothetical protein AOQ89_01780 [bacterium endosymbiont of Pedicinus badii]
MCGIFGIISKNDVIQKLLRGLFFLKYRGYDSSGIAYIDKNNRIKRFRTVGTVEKLVKKIKDYKIHGKIGIAHTRWATHGIPNLNNAHPHISDHIALVHNGIIENNDFLKKKVKNLGYKFQSDTDSETIAHLLHWFVKNNSKNQTSVKSIKNTLQEITGSYALAIIDSYNPNAIFLVRFKSPLIVGIGKEENFLSSDIFAILPFTKKIIVLEEGDIAKITEKKIDIWDKSGKKIFRNFKVFKNKIRNFTQVSKGHYMIQEILEQPKILEKITKKFFVKKGIIIENLKCRKAKDLLSKVESIKVVACGSSYHASLVFKYWVEEICRISCSVEIASEFRYRKFVVKNNTLFVTVSQSGETADILESLNLIKKFKYLASLSVCNSEYSSASRNSDFSIIIPSGLEISVASTKSFTSQMTCLLIFCLYIGRIQNKIKEKKIAKILQSIKKIPEIIKKIFSIRKKIKSISKKLNLYKNLIVLGKGKLYPIAMECALKFKEITYIHAEAYTSGELKHGSLALIDQSMPVLVLISKNSFTKKVINNVEEIICRNGLVYIFCDEDVSLHFKHKKISNILTIPKIEDTISPILQTIMVQILSYYSALFKGNNIDQPRNLAKSVTVE